MEYQIAIFSGQQSISEQLKDQIRLLQPTAYVVVVLETTTACIDWLRENGSVDLIISDIRLRDGCVFPVLEQIKFIIPVIFMASCDERALKAFKYNAIDYLRKPVQTKELGTALRKAIQAHYLTRHPALATLCPSIKLSMKKYRSRFVLPIVEGYTFILIEEVCYFCSELEALHAHLKNGTDIALPFTLEQIEEELDPQRFFRANRQFIININEVTFISEELNGNLKAQLKNDAISSICIIQEKAAEFKAWIGG